MQKRIAYLDLAGGIMTIWVWYFHALFPIFDGKILDHVPWLYFFMPWFFYKSGMMFKPKDRNVEWHNGVKKLLKTFAVWSIIGYIAHVLWHWYIGDLTPRLAFYTPLRSLLLGSSVPLNGAIWFIPVLFLVRQLGNYLLPRFHVLWIVILSLCMCILLQFVHIPFLPNWISVTISWGLFFFSFAYWIRNYETNKWVVLVAAIIYGISVFTPISIVYGGDAPLWSRLLYYPSCAFACVFFNNACRWLMSLTERFNNINWHFPILSYVGKYAMNFYVPHYILFMLTFDMVARYNDSWYSGWQGLVIITIVYVTIIPTINIIVNNLINRHNCLNINT